MSSHQLPTRGASAVGKHFISGMYLIITKWCIFGFFISFCDTLYVKETVSGVNQAPFCEYESIERIGHV